ncbi:unnamed protein product [Urochloa humidicola]
MIPLNLTQEQATSLASTFGCQLGSLPFTYLGLPLGTTKPKIEDYMPLMDRIEKRLTSTSAFLTQAGRLQLVNSVLSSLPTYMMCILKIPIAVLEFIDRARKHCLWRGSDINAKGKALVAWTKTTRPKNKGGLGIIDLRSQNEALLLKHLDKFYNKKDIPWINLIWNSYYSRGQIPHATADRGSFWWKDILHLCDKFRGIAACTVGNGTTVLFWLDVWNGQLLQEKLPRLFSFAKNQKISVAKFFEAPHTAQHFHLPLSDEAHQEYQELQNIIQDLQMNEEEKDKWFYIWGSEKYTSRNYYNHRYKNFQPPRPFLWIWESRCTNKLRVFFWLLMMDRLNTRNILRRKNLQIEGNNYSCVLCQSNSEETAMHLFFSCSFAKKCWQEIGVQWDMSTPFFQMLQHAKQNFNHSCFMEIIIIAAWQIWKQRNGLIFENCPATFTSWKRKFKEECLIQAVRIKDSIRPIFLNWANNFV